MCIVEQALRTYFTHERRKSHSSNKDLEPNWDWTHNTPFFSHIFAVAGVVKNRIGSDLIITSSQKVPEKSGPSLRPLSTFKLFDIKIMWQLFRLCTCSSSADELNRSSLYTEKAVLRARCPATTSFPRWRTNGHSVVRFKID